VDSDLARGQSHLRADAATNRQALLDAAARLYSERGLDVPYEEIAREAGVGRATLYRHFPTRELMLTGIMDAMLDRFAQTAAELPDTPDAFFALFDEAVRIQRQNLTLVELAVTTARPPEHSSRARARLEDLFREPLRAAQAAGLVRSGLEPADVYVLLVMLSALTRESVAADAWSRAQRLARLAVTEPKGVTRKR
jgi:AcrR family transcriptional regulator